jgi:hypothetical protein
MLNKDRELNRKQLFWKFREEDGLFYHSRYPWEHKDPYFKEFRGEYDTLFRSGLAYIAYGDEDIKQGILNCFRPYIIGEDRNPERTKYQASRASNRFGEDDVSRDQIILALTALEFNGDIEEVKEIANKLSFRVSKRFLMTPTMWFWVKYLGIRKKGWKNAFAFMQTLEHSINIPLTKFLRWLSGATKPIPLPHNQHSELPYKEGWKLQLYKLLGYPEYGLHFAAWQQYVVPFGGVLGKLNKRLMRWQMQDSNLLLRILVGEEVSKEEIENFHPTNTFMWQRRTDIATAWIYKLNLGQFEYNNLEVDILNVLN